MKLERDRLAVTVFAAWIGCLDDGRGEVWTGAPGRGDVLTVTIGGLSGRIVCEIAVRVFPSKATPPADIMRQRVQRRVTAAAL